VEAGLVLALDQTSGTPRTNIPPIAGTAASASGAHTSCVKVILSWSKSGSWLRDVFAGTGAMR